MWEACVGMCAGMLVLSIHPSIQTVPFSVLYRPPDPFFCVNNKTPANHGQKERQMPDKGAASSLSHVRVPTLPVDRAGQRCREKERKLSSLSLPPYLFSLFLHISAAQRPVELILTHPQPSAQGCAAPMATLPT